MECRWTENKLYGSFRICVEQGTIILVLYHLHLAFLEINAFCCIFEWLEAKKIGCCSHSYGHLRRLKVEDIQKPYKRLSSCRSVFMNASPYRIVRRHVHFSIHPMESIFENSNFNLHKTMTNLYETWNLRAHGGGFVLNYLEMFCTKWKTCGYELTYYILHGMNEWWQTSSCWYSDRGWANVYWAKFIWEYGSTRIVIMDVICRCCRLRVVQLIVEISLHWEQNLKIVSNGSAHIA